MQHRHASQPLCLPRRPLLCVVPIQGSRSSAPSGPGRSRVPCDERARPVRCPDVPAVRKPRMPAPAGGTNGQSPTAAGHGSGRPRWQPGEPPFRRAAIRIFDACGLSLAPSSWVLLTMNPGPSRARGCWRSLGSPRPNGGFFRVGSFPKNSTHDISSSGGTQTPKKLAQAGGDSGDQQLQGEGKVLLVLDLGHDRHRGHGQRIVTTRDLGVAAHPGLVILGRFFTQ